MNERLQAILNAIQYVDSHLREPIAVVDIASAAGFSLYHFIRTFNQTVHHTPYDYLIRRRLSKAARDLLDTERRVIDIALDYQFNNHETFTRAFGRIFGMSPSRWREQGFADHRVLMPALNLDDLEFISAPGFEMPKLVRLDEIILAGLMTPVSSEPEKISSLWQYLRGVLQVTSFNLGSRDFWGLSMQPQIPEGISFYLAAVKISSQESAPSTFVIKKIPAGDYVRLTQPSPMTKSELGFSYLYHTFLPKAGLLPLYPWEIEHFGNQREALIPVQTKQDNRVELGKSRTGGPRQDA
jgi:AraC family transcriptional regulator